MLYASTFPTQRRSTSTMACCSWPLSSALERSSLVPHGWLWHGTSTYQMRKIAQSFTPHGTKRQQIMCVTGVLQLAAFTGSRMQPPCSSWCATALNTYMPKTAEACGKLKRLGTQHQQNVRVTGALQLALLTGSSMPTCFCLALPEAASVPAGTFAVFSLQLERGDTSWTIC